MPGCQRGSSSQQKTANQPSTSAESAAQQQKLPSAFAALALDQRCSPDCLNDGECVEFCPTQQGRERRQSKADGTAGAGPVDKLSDVNTNGCSSPPAELQGDTPHMSKLSLFRGMELVTKGGSLCIRETEGTVDNSAEVTASNVMKSIGGRSSNTTVCNAALSNCSQPVSAFSFVNF